MADNPPVELADLEAALSSLPSKPNPDPTVYTNEAIERAVKAERDYVQGEIAKVTQRFEGLDEATRLARSDIQKIPDATRRHVGDLKELIYVELKAIDDKFVAAEKVRIEQKQDSEKSLGAALTAAKELGTETTKAGSEAIRKSEAGTIETIKSDRDANKAITDQLTKDLDGLKLLVNSIVSSKQGGTDAGALLRAVVASVIGVILLILTVVSLYFATKNNTQTDNNNNVTTICSTQYHPPPCAQ